MTRRAAIAVEMQMCTRAGCAAPIAGEYLCDEHATEEGTLPEAIRRELTSLRMQVVDHARRSGDAHRRLGRAVVIADQWRAEAMRRGYGR